MDKKKFEREFYQALEDLFIGAKIEGKSGYINLMKFKSGYYNNVVKPALMELVDQELEKNGIGDFREELFEKLYTFFKRYFSESGSIYFTYTPWSERIYERVYDPESDVALFWKTHMLYYVKTEKNYQSMEVTIKGINGKELSFWFDVSNLEHKKANEKKELNFTFKNIDEKGRIILECYYKEGNKETNVDEIAKQVRSKVKEISSQELKQKLESITTDDIERAFQIFNKQSEVDYFINKDAEKFLKEQLDMFIYQYMFDSENIWSAKRVMEIQTYKKIAEKIIEFIAQFENELVKIWNKPKFVFNSNYVITLDRILAKPGGKEVIEKLRNHPGMENQIAEWKELGIVGEGFTFEEAFNTKTGNLFEEANAEINPKYQFLPIDTKYFKDIEIEILKLFDRLDDELDGWLIKSENYQALNTILPKFREKVQTIYIDPPFNKEQDADYLYKVKYKDSTWITMLENRVRLARDLLKETGSIFVRCDQNGNMYVRLLMYNVFGPENFKNEIAINRKRQSIGTPDKLENETESIFLYSKSEHFFKRDIYRARSLNSMKWTGFLKQEERNPPERYFFGKKLMPPHGQHFSLNQEKVDKLLRERFLRLKCKECGAIYYYDEEERKESFIDHILQAKDKFKFIDITPKTKVYGVKTLDTCLSCGADNWKVEYLTSDELKITDNWKDIVSYSDTQGFRTENSEVLLKRVMELTSSKLDIIVDFFLGSGTTTAVAHKLRRKWIGIEMGEHFYTVILPRMKKVLAYDKSGISKEDDVKEFYNENNAGGFFKYYELEQYEDVLRNAKYEHADLMLQPSQGKDVFSEYVFMRSPKFVEHVLEKTDSGFKVSFEKLYPDKKIDIAETLSNVLGEKILKILDNAVILEKSGKIEFENIPIEYIKPLIWW